MRFDCIRYHKATTKPQGLKGAFIRMLTVNQQGIFRMPMFCPGPSNPRNKFTWGVITKEGGLYSVVMDTGYHILYILHHISYGDSLTDYRAIMYLPLLGSLDTFDIR